MCTSQDMYLSALAAPGCFCISKWSEKRQIGDVGWNVLKRLQTLKKKMETRHFQKSPISNAWNRQWGIGWVKRTYQITHLPLTTTTPPFLLCSSSYADRTSVSNHSSSPTVGETDDAFVEKKKKRQKPTCLHGWLAHWLEWNCKPILSDNDDEQEYANGRGITKNLRPFFFWLSLLLLFF